MHFRMLSMRCGSIIVSSTISIGRSQAKMNYQNWNRDCLFYCKTWFYSNTGKFAIFVHEHMRFRIFSFLSIFHHSFFFGDFSFTKYNGFNIQYIVEFVCHKSIIAKRRDFSIKYDYFYLKRSTFSFLSP